MARSVCLSNGKSFTLRSHMVKTDQTKVKTDICLLHVLRTPTSTAKYSHTLNRDACKREIFIQGAYLAR